MPFATQPCDPGFFLYFGAAIGWTCVALLIVGASIAYIWQPTPPKRYKDMRAKALLQKPA